MTARPGGVRLALSWLTVVPVPQPRSAPDRTDGRRVIAAVPVVGALLGAATAALAFGLGYTALPAPVIGALCVVFLALATRGMHLDGLADTADGLGCYGDPERVRAVMRSGDVGPFGAATLVLVLLLQALTVGGLAAESRWYDLAFAVFLGRVAVVIACRSGLPSANPDGFGALVAGTQRAAIAVWLVVAAIAVAGAGWLGAGATPAFQLGAPIRAAIALIVVVAFGYAFTRHCARRIGGVSGDVLGATIELSTTLALVVLLA
ncbi:adenosylcobinamide-GDP ribazoletransferase [Gordonia sp. (in: high G+C Gram-positive bacteria)]|uniref:adenosylcobinamide-GDP ribazoletransferase n=1 Tax=Gordonia sp. (in: high G+C Gram-positive bacteria) TaxID=84139 RepID=UPI0026232E52|nr:adenosylcobinamide-GDP ribazoletransferase [Gordonia sp. (in: high G+C Gram-positive bacteria)]